MPARLRPAPAVDVAGAWSVVRRQRGAGDDAETEAAMRLLTKHYLAVLAARAPGHSVEVRVPPYAVVQCLGGSRHTRGTPPAVVETDGVTWLALACGELSWTAAVDSGRVQASGERSDLGPLLPLT
ncbi:MAG: sterol carrier family protein [Actinomycetota bacterium]|nr:sterol carrier family protein [Actinomycetota bacterium]